MSCRDGREMAARWREAPTSDFGGELEDMGVEVEGAAVAVVEVVGVQGPGRAPPTATSRWGGLAEEDEKLEGEVREVERATKRPRVGAAHPTRQVWPMAARRRKRPAVKAAKAIARARASHTITCRR